MSSINNGLPNGNKEIHKKSLKWLSNKIHIPKFIVNQFRSLEEVEARNLKFETASETWQESDKGEEYESMTSTLEDFLADLETFEETVDTEM